MKPPMFVRLRLLADVVQTATPATEGAHHSLDCIRGATLLGAVAAVAYERLGEHAFVTFHSGKVRFGDAKPLVAGQPALPAPLAWYRPKHGQRNKVRVLPGGSDGGGTGTWKQVRDERFTEPRQGPPVLFQAKSGFRLKTAVDRNRGGRPQDSMLFGYESLPAGTEWLARIDWDDDVPEAVVRELRSALDEKDIWLGRSRAAEYGRAKASLQVTPAPTHEDPAGHTRKLLVHCISDLLLVDPESGQPRLLPAPADFGLPAGFAYRPECSDLRTARYSPFHGKRKRRGVERVLIQRGSVLCFEGDQEVDRDELRRLLAFGVGECRAEGFGEVRVDPWYLAEKEVTCEMPAVCHAEAKTVVTPDMELARWMQAQRDAVAAEGKVVGAAKTRADELVKLWRKAEKDKLRRPSVTQWQRMAGLAVAHARAAAPSAERLREQANQVLQTTAGNEWREKVFGKTFLDTLLQALTEEGSDREKALRFLLAAKYTARKIQQGRHDRQEGS